MYGTRLDKILVMDAKRDNIKNSSCIKALTILPTPTPSSVLPKTTPVASHKIAAPHSHKFDVNSDQKRTATKPSTNSSCDPALKNNFYAILATSYAVTDSGCTHNYLTDKVNVKTKKQQHTQIRVSLPDATTLESTHACELDLPTLPSKAREEGYVIPGMKNHSLMSLTQLCNEGCKIVMNADELIVIYKGMETMRGIRMKEMDYGISQSNEIQRMSHMSSMTIANSQHPQQTVSTMHQHWQKQYNSTSNACSHPQSRHSDKPLTTIRSSYSHPSPPARSENIYQNQQPLQKGI